MESSSSSMTVTDNDSSAEIVFDFDQGKNIILDRLLSFSPNLEFVSIIVGVDRNRKLFNVPLLDLATELFHHPSITSYFEARVLIRVFEGVSKISFRVTYHFEERSGKISHFKKGKVVFRTYYRVEEMIEEFHQALKSQRYIVVVINFAPSYDHIPNWFPEDYNSSRVIWATTCDYNHPPVHSLVQENFQLQNGITEAWEYLRDKVFADRICPLELTNQGMQIAKNCLGVRPVLDRAARLLRETEMTSYEWEYIVRSGVFQIIFRDKVFYFFGYIPRLSKGDHSFMIDEENKKKNRDPEKRIEVLLHPIKKNVVEKEPENLVVGLDDDLLKINHQLTGLPCQLEIITIVGMGGIGKTTLAKAIFADLLVQYHFYVCAWIKISQVYELRGLLLEILQNIGHLNDETGKMNTDQLKEKLRQKLKGRRFLIVMDDLWSSQAWDSMITCFPNDNNGSRILLTTQLKNLAAHASLKTAPHEMRFLDKEQSWELMRYQIFKTKICPTGLVEIGKKIAEKCRGLPLSILVTGGVLSNMSQTSDGWEKVAENLNSVLTNDPEKSLNILALSYNYLPPHLKACFLYMSAFPEDCEIDCWSLKRLWVAEGFIKEESGRNLEDLAERFLEDLVKRNLVLVGKRRSTGGIKTCQLHDTIRELSLREVQKEICMQVITKGDHSFMIDEENKKKNRDPEKRIEVLHPIKKNVVEKEPENLVVGLDDDLLKIKHQLTGLPCQLEIITIVGMGGIGKTTLAKAIFADRLVQYHFYVCAWIKISQVYELRGLLLEILQNIGHLNDETGKMNTDQLKEKLRQKLKGRRFLIVMDDLWSSQAWDSMITCFPNDNNGSRILLTTRLKNLAAHASLKTAPHEMRFLDKEQSWELMRYQIFKTKICPTGLVEIGKKIAEKCRGLPLSILVTGGVLSNMSQTSDGWEKVAENLNSVLTDDPEKSLNILALSYNYLPPHLKACFLYMSAFPEDCEINCWRLKRLWVAEGFIKEESGRNLEDLAERFLEDLVKRNLVLVGKRRSTGGIKTCQLHDTIRELSLREAQKENFMQVITRNVEVHSKGDIVSCRLSFHSGSCSSFQPDPTVELDAFLCFDVGFGSIPDIGFSLSEFNFKLLKVLDINFLRFDYFPDLILNLIHLRFLALTAACEIPSSISKLLNLQTLIVLGPWLSRKHGKIPTLPVEFWKMSQLRHLNFSAAILLTGPLLDEDDASGSVVLMNLQTLNTLRSMSCTEQLFKSLPNLKKLGIRQIKEDLDTPNGSSHFLRSLIHLHQLEKLKCSFYFQNRETMHLPELQAFPERLKKLTLNGGKFPWTEMEILGKLPKLEVLKLKEYAFQGPIWEANEGGFPSLKVLLIQKTDLEHWNADRYSFPGLQSLVLSFCESLEEIPNEIVDDMLLIELHHCSSSAERSAREIQEVQRSSGNDDLVIRIISKGQMSNAESNDP